MANLTAHEIADGIRELCLEFTNDMNLINIHLADLRKYADMIDALAKPTIVPPELPAVPYRSQWDDDAKYIKSDCGPAALAMLLEFRGIVATIDEISIACGMNAGKRYTTAGDLARVSKSFDLELVAVSDWTLEQFAAQTPCIILIHYSAFKDRQDVNYTGGHWLVLLGVRGNEAIFHDPDWKAPRRDEGAARRVDTIIFAMGMHDCIQDGNRSGTGLVMAH